MTVCVILFAESSIVIHMKEVMFMYFPHGATSIYRCKHILVVRRIHLFTFKKRSSSPIIHAKRGCLLSDFFKHPTLLFQT